MTATSAPTSAPPLSALRRIAGSAWRARMRALPLTAFERDFRVAEPHTMLGVRRLKSLHDAVRETAGRGVAGDIVECGVARGGSALLMSLSARRVAPGRTLWLFDTFEGLPEPDAAVNPDVELARQFTGECRGPEADVLALLTRLAPQQAVRTVRGLFADTMLQPPVERIAMMHVDGDWYESVKPCLDALWPRLSPGGLAQVDDYGSWLGCRRAVDEFVAEHPGLSIETVDGNAVRLRKPG